jgi:8-oxo-dGTP diphosphatase
MARIFIRRAIFAAAITHQLLLPSFSVALAPLPKYVPPLCHHQNRYLHRTNHLPSWRTMNSSIEYESTNYIDKLALILINSNRQQLVARSYDRTVFYTPGGKREAGESDIDALIRECREELSVDLLSSTNTPAIIERYGTFEAQAYGKPLGTIVRLTCFRISPRDAELELEHMVKASEEVEELNWIDSCFDKKKLTVTGIMILEDLKAKEIIE